MADFLSVLRSEVLLCDGAMGSYLFELTGRLSEPNHVYETFNLDRPELVQQVHASYLAAGARCLKTNTFGANHAKLESNGLQPRLAEINQAGVSLARQAIERFRETTAATAPCFVLASVGPTEQPLADAAAVARCYREQLENLIEAGADAILFETFESLAPLEQLIDLARSLPDAPPIIAEMTIQPARDSRRGFSPDPAQFLASMVSRAVPVAGVNCCAPWDASAFIDAAGALEPVRSGAVHLTAMPNAGGFQRIGNRFMSSVNPEFMGKLARRFRDQGLRLVGGCCEVHPPHIQEMHNYLQSRDAARRPVLAAHAAATQPPADDRAKRGNGRFSRKLKDGEFVVSIEMLPPRGTSPAFLGSRIDVVRDLAATGLADAIDVTDGSRGIPLMPPGDFIQVIRDRLGWSGDSDDPLELIPHFTGRDLNVMGIQSRLIGYHARQIHNVLFITGDPPKMSPTYPRSTAVFDLDSVAMIRLTHQCLNAGVDFGGAPLGKPPQAPTTHFTIGTGFEPEAVDQERERMRLEQKIEHGADYLMTQPAFRHEPLAVLDPYRDRIPVLVGVMILTGLAHAERVARIPGVVLPETILERLAAVDDPADQARIGVDLAVEQIHWILREGYAGLYLMSPGSAGSVATVLAEARG